MKDILISKIKSSVTNPRQNLGDLSELEASMKSRLEQKKRAIIEPLIVKDLGNEFYQLVIGNRRLEAAKNINLKTVPCLIEDFDTEDAMIAGLIENCQRKDLEWYELSAAFDELRKKGKTAKEIAKQIGKSESFVYHLTNAQRVIDIAPGAKEFDMSVVREISYQAKEDYTNLVKVTKEKDLDRDQIKKISNKAKKIESRIELLEATHPKLAESIKEFWYPLRHENIYNDMVAEIKIRLGRPDSREFFFPEEKFTEEEIKKYVKSHMGEYVGKITKSWYRIFIVPKTIKELREKWTKKD